MTLMVHPAAFYESESLLQHSQKSYSRTDPNDKYMRYLEEKPALLVLTDDQGTILHSIVGKTSWKGNVFPPLGEEFDLGQLYARQKTGAASAAVIYQLDHQNKRPMTPYVPLLVFDTQRAYSEEVRNAGTVAKAYLVVDKYEHYSSEDITLWPDELWQGQAPLDINSLPEGVSYLMVSTGASHSDNAVFLSDLHLDPNTHIIRLVNDQMALCFPNLIGDWSDAKAQMMAIIADFPYVGHSYDEVVAKETPPVV
ncbi:hypothetical protein [Pseudoalteromonas umbrosa]|uniref:hypothetical protein n=1 Tax=Pseudoalteromonas umbrosa TaxID=3048489 RepID=UPI0024C47042|nr:hypothetical protein [Pseudoalteromonas sp. B95]MDK1290080.1 hypothetical protein [Pseudoalteromonas sp. B95]